MLFISNYMTLIGIMLAHLHLLWSEDTLYLQINWTEKTDASLAIYVFGPLHLA